MMLAIPPSLPDRSNDLGHSVTLQPQSLPLGILPTHRARQYAYPAQSRSTASKQNGHGEYSFAEHVLRRKTPHGVIPEDYDGTPTDKSVQLPAAKHVLVASPPEVQRYDPMHSTSVIRLTENSLRQNNSAALATPHITQSSGLRQSSYTAPHQQATPRGGQDQGQGQGQGPWELVGLDSMLNQTLPTHPTQRYYLQCGSSIPTVLPNTTQMYMVPTISASHSRWGPYWPDGTFSPYRPAPVRDNRFDDRRTENVAFPGAGSMNEPLMFDNRTAYSTKIGSQRAAHDAHSLIGRTAHTTYASFTDRVNSASRQQSSVGLQSTNSHLHATAVSQHFGAIARQLPVRPDHEKDVAHASVQTTFEWCRKVCYELLAYVHENLKSNPYQRESQPRQSSIFPKPPSTSGPVSFTGTTHDQHGYPRSKIPEAKTSFSSLAGDSITRDLSRPPTAVYFSTDHTPESLCEIAPTLGHNLHSRPSDLSQTGQTWSTRRASEPTSYRHVLQHENLSIFQKANMALNAMTSACEEQRHEWVEGMLLAGCLCYGLGYYPRALTWFQTTLYRDASHVEAMSNLAATLLALDRKEEAIQHWFAAIKLRPSYFEAVEHLVGLLASSRRSRDAVSVIELVENALRLPLADDSLKGYDSFSDGGSEVESRSSSIATVESLDRARFEYEADNSYFASPHSRDSQPLGFGSSGFAIPGAENYRLLQLFHAKGNMLYAQGDNTRAAKAFEDAILIASGRWRNGIRAFMKDIVVACISVRSRSCPGFALPDPSEPILLAPEHALRVSLVLFHPSGRLPGLDYVSAYKPANDVTSNSLLSLAKIYQDGMSSNGMETGLRATASIRDILALYYLSMSLNQSPSTANNVGILLAGVQQMTPQPQDLGQLGKEISKIPGVVPGSGVALALAYYNYGLQLDKKHAHLYTNFGSLLKDLGQLDQAIHMYELAVECDGKFDIALANLANAVKDQGRVKQAIGFYSRAVEANPNFAEAVCGLATALNSVCSWRGRGGLYADGGRRDRFHVDDLGMLFEGQQDSGWVSRVAKIVEKQLRDGESWGVGTLTPATIESLSRSIFQDRHLSGNPTNTLRRRTLEQALHAWSGTTGEGARVVRLVERAIRQIGWQWYQDRYVHRIEHAPRRYSRPSLPPTLTSPSAPTVLPFHTFTAPLSAKQIRQISQRNALRISVSTLRSSWLPPTVYPPPRPPAPQLKVGYVSSDFNNHPLAHLMQSVFGLHDRTQVLAYCYATTASDGSRHRLQIEREAPVFLDASTWSVEQLVKRILEDGIHILVNLNGYTRGARNEVFAARPAPVQMSFMGFAGTLGAEWCDYIYADAVSIPPETRSTWRGNVSIEDRITAEVHADDSDDWIYSENIIFARSSFFCCDHKQSAPDAADGPPRLDNPRAREMAWEAEQDRRWTLRNELFPGLSESAVVLGNFNQLYKIDPSTFSMYLRILAAVPNSVLWLLRFPDLGEQNLLQCARDWAGRSVAERIIFTDVAPKGTHITRASVLDLFLDTPECNAHTTAADVAWSGTPIVTWGKWKYKMCSRMAGSIVGSALPEGREGDRARRELIVQSEQEYEGTAIALARGLHYISGRHGRARGRLMELRRMMWEGRWTNRLFDTARWVRDLEQAYWLAWKKWEAGEGGDIWL